MALASQAGAQHGVIAAAQLAALGLAPRGQRHRVAVGRLHRLFAGVYAVGHAQPTPDGWRMAAVLASGARAVLSHRSAAAAWGLVGGDGAGWDVTTPGHRSRAPARVRLHRTRRLDAPDVTTLRGIPVTTVARTLVDLAGVLDHHRLERALHEAEILRLLDVADVRRCLERLPGRRGTATLLAAVTDPSGPRPTRSELEERFLRLCRASALLIPRTNAHVDAGDRLIEVDALWPDHRVVVELDGEHVHRTRRAFHDDRRRDTALAARGYVVLRLTWQRVTQEPAAVAADLGGILALRAPSGPGPRP